MADFYPILARAIAGLSDKSPEARRAVYDRARTALIAQLRGLDPPLGEAEIMRERLTLDEAVARIELDYSESEQPAEAEGAEDQIFQPLPDGSPFSPTSEPAEPVPDPFEPEPLAATEAQPLRPRLDPPRERRLDPRHIRTAIVGAGVAIAVAAIAATAIYIGKPNPSDPAIQRPKGEPQTKSGQDDAGKLSDRLGDPASQNPGSSTPPSTATPPQPSQNDDITVAQRAILYIESPQTPQQPQAIAGQVTWRLDSESAGQGRPVETIIRATVDIAKGGLSLDFTVRRNTDTAFPASHLIGMRFIRTGDANNDIRELGVPQFKTEESERGAPLSAISTPLGDNLFVTALSNVPVETERNLDLMRSRNWIDIPVRFASGKRGIITFEKGTPGSRVLSDAISRWR